jgi:hypothetical protein
VKEWKFLASHHSFLLLLFQVRYLRFVVDFQDAGYVELAGVAFEVCPPIFEVHQAEAFGVFQQ